MARSIDLLARTELPLELVLESCLPDYSTDRRLSVRDPQWLRELPDFESDGRFDFDEYQADLIYSTSGLIR